MTTFNVKTSFANAIDMLRNPMIKLWVVLTASMYASQAAALKNKVELEKTGGIFSSVENFLQTVLDFFQGPYAVIIAFGGMMMVAAGIMFAKEASGVILMGMRVLLAVGLIFAIGPALAYFI